jgi:ribonuclease HI
MTDTTTSNPNRLKLWQQNLNKSRVAHEDLINSDVYKNYDALVLQEPYIDGFGNTKATKDWRVVYPTSHLSQGHPIRSVILINAKLDTNQWAQLSIQNTGDLVAIQINGTHGDVIIIGIYNDCTHSTSLTILDSFLKQRQTGIQRADPTHILWCGDFNRHHPYWDEERNRHLFTARAIREAETLLGLIADHHMVMALPKDIPTLESMATKNWTRPDNVFCTDITEGLLVECSTDPRLRGPGTDHVPILTTIEIPVKKAPTTSSYNYRLTDWDKFREELSSRLLDLERRDTIANAQEVHEAVKELTETLQDVIRTTVPQPKPTPHSKRWWSNRLTILKKKKNKLSNISYRYRALPDHISHEEHRKARNEYGKEILISKKEHWTEFLEGMSYGEIWTANRYISSGGSDGGKTRIPTLTLPAPAGSNEAPREAISNEEKSAMLADYMFPKCPESCMTTPDHEYDTQLPARQEITEDQVRRHIQSLSPYKAPGPDEIPNIVLKECADLLLPYLGKIFRAIIGLQVYPATWKEAITCVIRKPGKTRYDMPKAYRPIALLNTMAKLLSAIVAEEITHMTEKHQLLPMNHFGGRPGRTTTDSLHLLTDTIKAAWRRKQVVSVMFLDIEGAFPNAVTSSLLHNLRKRGIPEVYATFVRNMLTGRRTRLKFDDYISDWHELNNGIGQGDPLSMILYLYYNADVLDIPQGKHEMGLGYVDDKALIAIDKTFEKAHHTLKRMMTRPDGANEWSRTHNSRFELSKLVLVDFTRSRSTRRPPLTLQDTTLIPQQTHKFLGVLMDQELRWNHQADYALGKATKWTLAFRRLARPSTGIHPRLMRQLYNAVAIPKITYAADVWYTPTYWKEGMSRCQGSVGVTKRLASLQRIATVAITGALRTTATDVLDIHANVLPVALMMRKICYRAAVRLATLPRSHPLRPLFIIRSKRFIKTHRSPLHELARLLGPHTANLETISPSNLPPGEDTKCKIVIHDTAEGSVAHARGSAAEIRIFADGSGVEGKAGAAAAMYKGSGGPRILRFHLGTLMEHTTFEAEAIGLQLALHMLKFERNAKKATVWLDNQAVIQSISNRKPKPAQYLINKIRRQTKAIWRRAEHPAFQLEIAWVKGHNEVEGNERVDREAKKAARGESSQARNLPSHLTTNPLPVSSTAMKQSYDAKLAAEWKEIWKASSRFPKLSKIDPELPSKGYKRLTAGLSRKQSSILIQLRTGHIPLNHYLHRISKTASSTCPSCQQDEETVQHYLFECTTWKHERWHMSRNMGRAAKSISNVLNTQKGVKEVMQYIGRTGRLRSIYGEVPNGNNE